MIWTCALRPSVESRSVLDIRLVALTPNRKQIAMHFETLLVRSLHFGQPPRKALSPGVSAEILLSFYFLRVEPAVGKAHGISNVLFLEAARLQPPGVAAFFWSSLQSHH